MICNSIELIGKIFTNNDSNSLYRYDFRAEPSKFEYILNGYASDIVKVAFQLKDPKDPVRIMAGSTTSIIKIPSRFAVGIEVGNEAYFQNDDTINFYPIDTVTKIDIYYTEIGFSTPLPFAIVEGHSFEIASNVTIYEEKYNLNYSQKGVVKYVNKDTEARIKFLDLSEPPPGVFITVFYKKIQDYKIKFQNDVSKNLFGLKYKEIKLDDDIVLTQLEMDNLSSNLLVLDPKLTFSVNSKRIDGLAPVGMNIPVVVNGFLNQNFILQNNSWEYLGKDPQKQHIFNQDLDFSNIINDPENYIKSLKKRKATKSTELNTKDIMKELLNITEKVSYTDEIIARLTQFPETITGAWGTLTLDYGYIFNPQSSGDLTDYSGNNNIATLDRRNSGDSYPSWVQVGGAWGLYFTDDFSALRVADSASLELNTVFTIISIIKMDNDFGGTYYRYISSKWWASNIFTFSLRNYSVNLYKFIGNTQYVYNTVEDVVDTNLNAYSNSFDCTTNTKVNVKNQSSNTLVDIVGTSIPSIDNISSDLFIGSFVEYPFGGSGYSYYSGYSLQGKMLGYAIIRQALTDSQIKEIHRLMGF